jgi:hypothetical protein
MLQAEAAGARCQTAGAVRVTGAGFTTWGVALNGLFRPPVGGTWQPYDASGYKGLRFWARAATPLRIQVKLPDRNTHRTGGVCVICDDGFGKFVDVSTEWQPITILFAETTQIGFGDKVAAIAPSALYAIEFVAPKEAAFDLWVDDVVFLK